MIKLELITDFLIPKSEQEINFVHRTQTEKVAEKILEKGFKFADSFQKTTDVISDDPVYLKYWNVVRKTYGPFLILISFPKELINKYQAILNDIGTAHIEVQQLLTDVSPYQNSNNDYVYLIPSQFIKGYMNSETGEIVWNPKFKLQYFSEQFDENLRAYVEG